MAQEPKVIIMRRAATSTSNSDSAAKATFIAEAREKLEALLKMLVDAPNEVRVELSQGEFTTVFKIECSQKNVAKILGKGGKTIASLRNVMLAATAQHGFRSVIEVPYYPLDTQRPSHSEPA